MNSYANAAAALALAAVLGMRECAEVPTFDGETVGNDAGRFEHSRAWNKFRRRRLDSYPGQRGRHNRRKAS